MFVFFACAIFYFSCTPAKMFLNENNWTNKEEYKVKGRNGILIKEKLQFGNYNTTLVKRSWTKGNSNKNSFGTGDITRDDYKNLISIEYIQKKQTLQFKLADDVGNTSEVYAVSKFNAENLQVGNKANSIVNIAIDILNGTANNSNTYYVQIFTPQHAKPWELLLDNDQWQAKPQQYIGLVALDKNNYYTLKPVSELQKKNGTAAKMPFGAIGFEILNKENKPVAAVSLIDNGAVYFNTTDSNEKFLLANIATALLLQQNIE